MARYLLGAVALIVAIWVAFAVFRALGALVHLAMIVAILVVAFGLINLVRNASKQKA